MDAATYFGALGGGFLAVFSWPTFPLMMLGVLIGFVIGILPGISAPTTLALMLPFTFHMQPVEAFAFLLVVLSFASPEFFGLALLGIAFVAALSGGNMTKGVLTGALGLMLAMVGLDPQSGTQRYTFGQLELWEGVQLVPVTVGLFGVGELVDLWVKQKSIAEHRVGKIGGLWQGCKDTFIHWGVTLRCSLLGTFLGIIPGLGGSVGQWVSYAHAVQSTKDKSRFGKGDVRGVLGPGASMNAKEGGNLITTVAFGVPSSVSMAILLGAFLIQGIVPGPSMLTSKVELTLSFAWVIIVAHVISVGLCFLLINQMVKSTEIRSALILPAIVFLVLFGGYSERNSMFDVGVTLV